MAVFLLICFACFFKGSCGDFHVKVTRTGCLSFDFNIDLAVKTVGIVKDNILVLTNIYTSADSDDVLLIPTDDYSKRIKNFDIDRLQGIVKFCLVNTTFDDDGVYICDADGIGKISKRLFVLGSISDFFVNVTSTGCLSFELYMDLTTKTVSVVKDSALVWTSIYIGADSNNLVLMANDDYSKRIRDIQIDKPKGTVSFCLVNTTFDDSGLYMCDAGDKGRFNKTLYVLDIPTRPVLSILKNGIITSENGMLSCLSLSLSEPPGLPFTYTWSVNNNTITNETKYQCNRKDTCNELIIIVDRSDQFNDYTCLATAQYGQTSEFSDVKKIDPKYNPDAIPVIEQEPAGGIITGDKVTLRCIVFGGNPLATLSWDCQGNTINNTIGSKASYSVEFTVNKTYNNRICTCSATHPVLSYKPSVSHRLVVFYVPEGNLKIHQMPPHGIIYRHRVTLTCSVTGGNPLAKLFLDCKGNTTNSTTATISSYSVEFNVEKSDNSRVCTCTASHIISSYTPEVQHKLVVYYAPDNTPTIQQQPSGGIISGNNVILTCKVSGGNPLATLEWNCTGTNINTTAGNTASYSITLSVNRDDNIKTCACSTIHPDTSYLYTVHHVLIVFFGPGLPNVIPEPSMPWIEGNTTRMRCIYNEGNPIAKIKWKRNNIVILDESNPTIELGVVLKDDLNSSMTCMVGNEYGMVESDAVYLNIEFKPVLYHFRPYLDSHVSVTENHTLQLTLTINANPTPTVEWTFRAESDWNSCNFITIISNTTTNGLLTSSSILLDNIQTSNFGDYAFTASNTVGSFLRRFVVKEEASSRQDMCASTTENTGVLVAGIATIIVGMLSLTAALICVVWKSFKNKALKTSKSDEYTDVQRNNPAFTDAYTTLQPDVESRPPQTQIINTYEECGRISSVHSYSSVDRKESEARQPHQHGDYRYEKRGKTIEANAYDTLD